MKEISKMTPEELRVACAEKCGWRVIKSYYSGNIATKYTLFFNDFEISNEVNSSTPITLIDFIDDGLPDYINDRNALQDLIKTVPEDRASGFIADLEMELDLDLQWYNNIHKLLTADPLAVMRAFLEVME